MPWVSHDDVPEGGDVDFATTKARRRCLYRGKLGFDVRDDATMDNGFRWPTVGPMAQPGMRLALMKVEEGPMCSAERAAILRQPVQDGAFGIGGFETDDCRATYAELKAKGVEFMREPEEEFYGIEVVGKDDSGN